MTHAAERLFITQPALSHRIQTLEEELNAQLFIRQRGIRKVKLTRAGNAFIVQAHKWRVLWAETKSFIKDDSPDTFSVATAHSITYSISKFIFQEFMKRNLPIFLTINSCKSSDAYKHIEDGQTDAALLSTAFFSNAVHTIPIAKEKLVFVCHRNSDYEDVVSTQKLNVSQEICFEWGHDFMVWHEYWFKLNGFPLMFTDSIMVVENYIDSPGVWSLIPASVAEKFCAHNEARTCELTEPPPDKTIYFASPFSPKQPYCDLFLENVRDIMSNNPYIQMV